MGRIILASASPRRHELLRSAGIDVEVIIPNVDETPTPGTSAADLAVALARKKAESVAAAETESVIIGADTVVALGDEILGKPTDHSEAYSMLRKLSGKAHEVITGVCIVANAMSKTFFDITTVYFNDLSEEDIEYYITSFKPFDKAGGYAIQEWIGLVGIKRIEGDYFNVVGLPISRVVKALSQLQ